MSYDIYLNDRVTGQPLLLDVRHQMRGGTYCLGDTRECWLNITYNYFKYYYEVFGEKGIRAIYGLTGAESIPLLKEAISKLGDETSSDYWGGYARQCKKTVMSVAGFCIASAGRSLGRRLINL